MYFLDDWVSLQVGELLGSGAWLILGFPIYSLFSLSYLFSILGFPIYSLFILCNQKYSDLLI